MNSTFPSTQIGNSSTDEEKPLAYVKAIPLREYSDIEKIKNELKAGNILIVKLTPLAIENIEAVKDAIEELKAYVESVHGDIARLGEERVVITPPSIKIWRKSMEKRQ